MDMAIRRMESTESTFELLANFVFKLDFTYLVLLVIY